MRLGCPFSPRPPCSSRFLAACSPGRSSAPRNLALWLLWCGQHWTTVCTPSVNPQCHTPSLSAQLLSSSSAPPSPLPARGAAASPLLPRHLLAQHGPPWPGLGGEPCRLQVTSLGALFCFVAMKTVAVSQPWQHAASAHPRPQFPHPCHPCLRQRQS